MRRPCVRAFIFATLVIGSTLPGQLFGSDGVSARDLIIEQAHHDKITRLVLGTGLTVVGVGGVVTASIMISKGYIAQAIGDLVMIPSVATLLGGGYFLFFPWDAEETAKNYRGASSFEERRAEADLYKLSDSARSERYWTSGILFTTGAAVGLSSLVVSKAGTIRRNFLITGGSIASLGILSFIWTREAERNAELLREATQRSSLKNWNLSVAPDSSLTGVAIQATLKF